MPRYVGTTRRSVGPAGPLRHVFTYRHASQWGANKLALCGASIICYPGGCLMWDQPRDTPPPLFDPNHPRACRRCVAALPDNERT